MFKLVSPDISQFPSAVRSFFTGAKVYDCSHHSSSTVYSCDTGFYVKIGAKGALAEEARLGRLFHSMALGVEVAAYISESRDFLVTRSAAGKPLDSCLDDPKRNCEMLAKALRVLHSQQTAGVPISSRYQRYMDAADGDFSGGYYDESVSMDRFPVHSKEEAWAILQANRGLLQPDTFIHGDVCLSNVIFSQGQFACFIDFSMSGAGDRHIDLYWVVWSLQNTLKTDRFTDYFLDAYGREHFDYETLKVISAFEVFG